MSDKQNNITPIKNSHSAAANQGQILPKIHKLFVRGLQPAIRQYYDQTDDTLFDLAEKAENNEKQTQYFEAMREVRKKKEFMVRKFSENLQTVFKKFKKGQFDYYQTKIEETQENTSGLSLVNEQELDQKLAVSNLVGKADTYFHQPLFALQKRFTVLAGGSDLKVDQLPVSPDAIVNSFAESLDHLNMDVTIHLIMLKLFERVLIQHLAQPYQDINQYLVEQGILPQLKFTVGRPGTHAPAKVPEQLVPAEPNLTGEIIEDTHYAQISEAFAQRHPGSMVHMPAFDPGIINNALALLQLEELKNLNEQNQSLSPTEIKDQLISRLRELDNGIEEKQVNNADEDMIDLVGMLFQFVVEDRNLPDRIQALLARLQIPYLHLALKDRKLFSNKENPARKLLDAMAQAAIGWTEKDDKNGHFINEIESVVQNILESDLDNIDFESLTDSFQTFYAKHKKRSQVIEKRTSEKALGQERILSAKEKTASILSSKMSKHSLPKLVSDLLLTPWANVLILAHLRHQDEPQQLEQFIKFVDKLIFVSVKNKKRKANNAQISHVCDFMTKGLRMVAFDEKSIQEQHQNMYQLLLDINQINNTEEVAHEFVKPKDTFEKAETEEQPEIVHFIANNKLNRLGEEVEHVEDVYFDQANKLKTGDWIEFRVDENGIRSKLSWISPISQKRLFVNAKGVKVTDKSVDELAEDLRQKMAIVLQQIPLFDRAMSSIAQQLKFERNDNDSETSDQE